MPVIRPRSRCFMAGNIADTPLLPGGEACGIKGTVSYKRTGTGYKRRMRHTASMRDYEVPHGNIGCGQAP